tara:strand:- start:24877 stop:27087 length:2211 start_codon:yes stop_codon:yes gene_type:complete
MPKVSNKKKAENVHMLFQRASGSWRTKWSAQAQKCFDFYHNDQLSAEEERVLEESGMPSFTINRITPVIEMMKYFTTSKTPRWQAIAAEGSDTDIAAVHSDVAEYCWHLSNGDSLYAHVIQDSLIKGIGWFQIDVDPDMDRGMGEVMYKRIEPFDVFVDPMARDFLMRDASYIIVRKNLPRTQLINLFPEFKAKIKKASSDENQDGGFWQSMRNAGTSDSIQAEDIGQDAYNPENAEDDGVLDYYECYTKERYPLYNVFLQIPENAENLEEMKVQAQEQIEAKKLEMDVSYKEKAIELQELTAQGEIIFERAELELKIARDEMEKELEQFEVQLMNQIQESASTIEQQIMSEAEFSIIEKDPIMKASIVEAVKFYDTRIKLIVTLGSSTTLYETFLPITDYPLVPVPYMWTGTPYPMSAVLPLIGKQQEINKSHQLMIHNANLASNLRWMYEEGSVPEAEWEAYSSSPGALLKYRSGFSPPSPIMPAPINNAFFTTVQQGKTDMEYISGIYSSMQGDTGSQHDTYRGLLAQDEHGTRRIKAWMQTIVEPALEHLGKIFMQTSQNTYKAHKVFRIVQPSGIQEDRQVEINVPIYNDLGKSIDKFNDYTSAKFDVRIVAGSSMPVNRWALLEEYFRWYQSGLIDDIAMLGETDVRGKEQILKRKSVYSQLRSQVDALEGQLKDQSGENETLKRQLVQSNIRDSTGKAEKQIDAEMLQSKAQQKLMRQRMMDKEQQQGK